MKKKRIIKTKIYHLTENGERLLNKDELERANNLKTFLQNPPTHPINKDLPHALQVIFKGYNTAREKFFNDFALFEKNPVLERFKEVEKSKKEFIRSKKRTKNELYHQLTERELSRSEHDKKELEKEINRLKDQIKNDSEKVKLAFAMVNNLKPSTSKPTTPKSTPLTLNPNFDDPKTQINTIFENSKPLFISTLKQWENLFSKEIEKFNKPIELKPKTTQTDLSLFLSLLKTHGLIKNGRNYKILETVGAFSFHGKTLTQSQYQEARKNKMFPLTPNSEKVKQIFTALKIY